MEQKKKRCMVEITPINYQDFKDLDIVAFSCAECGAMGEHGGIIIVDTEGEVYHTTMFILSEETLLTVCPPLKDCYWGFFGYCQKLPDGWTHEYLGAGNHLMVKDAYVAEFKKRTKDIDDVGVLYQKWLITILDMLEKRNV